MNYVLGPLMQIPPIISKRNACKPLFDKISEMTKYEKEIDKEQVIFENSIKLENVDFSIENKKIINNINYSFEKNKSYAIVGPSGSGKTTLLNLLIGKLNNYQGSIKYDNKELNSISQDSLYEIISFIEQSVFVFDDTIINNITMFSKVDEQLLNEVIIKSGLDALINEKGLNYKCGENGCNLSGGEKQRIAIARGLIKKSQIMFLDEITSALDNETSNTITNNVLQLNDITKIMITHRLEESVLRNFDEIIVMKNGRIHEQGTYDELINNNNLFKTLVELN
jgi:ABC-type multidrug transport system fused ATPase/permease subunit